MTPIAAEGLALPPSLQALVAEDPATLAALICRLYRDTTVHREAVRAGRLLIRANHGAAAVASAAVATAERFPRAVRRRYVLCRRSCAFQASVEMSWGTGGQWFFIHTPIFGVVR